MLPGPVEVVVDAKDDVERPLLHGRRDDDLAHAGGEVRLERFRRSELPRALEHDLDALVTPWNLAGPGDAAVRHVHAVDHDRVAVRAHLVGPPAVDGVEDEQVRRGRSVAVQFVDVRERQLGPSPGCAQGQPSDPTEAVDADPRVIVICDRDASASATRDLEVSDRRQLLDGLRTSEKKAHFPRCSRSSRPTSVSFFR